MAGETNLQTLLKSMRPHLMEDVFVFTSLPSASHQTIVECELTPKATMIEDEGMTLVLTQSQADANEFEYEGLYACITLTVHSSLDAVGLTAAFANKLKDYDISANVIAGYYHDHIFVQHAVAEQALAALNEFTSL